MSIQRDQQELLKRITADLKQCGGRPCIRGMRIRVSDILDLLAAGLTNDQILKEMPDLELDDIRASISYAARKVNRATLAA
jgi:uncharacterized protein (DUF433 family)